MAASQSHDADKLLVCLPCLSPPVLGAFWHGVDMSEKWNFVSLQYRVHYQPLG